MPAPGDRRRALFGTVAGLHMGSALCGARQCGLALSERLNALQFLTIRRYLMLMFGALIVLLLIAAVWF